ncbi:peptidoglycan D,D-transpeptidase FtsI family protein [Roseovarius salinarum]|uniref:peptidoglycan D,D-transpeptidase FtsI family protein n=1 Tax=Roseovarius salinarum TaxID=1981892 RepID=UPI000C32AF54|nr:penicillin-binding protein 2 [Roseovarius salinarum]
MTRVPLRPLPRVLEAREKGENPDSIERENIRRRNEATRDRARARAESRLLVLAGLFVCAFAVIGGRMSVLASSEPAEPRASAAGAGILAQRADIVDRKGRILATNFETHSLYARPQDMIEPAHAAQELARIFPDLEAARLTEAFTGKRRFIWIKRKISPEQKQAVHDIGEPGLLFGPREMRLYPNGKLAAHVLGGASFGREGVHAAEVVGAAGVEKHFDARLRDPARGHEPLRLSLDLSVQAAVERVLQGGMGLMNAKGAASVLMDVHTGEIISIASLPDFDPNRPPPATSDAKPGDSPLFNRAVQGLYELGSTFKIFAAAQALELGVVEPGTMIDTSGRIRWGDFTISDMYDHGEALSVADVIVESSNVGTARIAKKIGADRQQDFMRALGLTEPTPFEIVEARGAKPLLPARWSELSAMTISFGHGISVSPLHLAAAYATIANGGRQITPTLLRRDTAQQGTRVLSPETARAARRMLRRVVADKAGTANMAEVAGYAVGGKTGTADKPKPTGGYYEDRVIATFASMFPAHDPRFVLVVMLDEPVETSGEEPRRTAGWTAVPVAAEIIRRVAPLLGLRPEIEPRAATDITLTSN